MPRPPPQHIVTSPSEVSVRSNSWSSVVIRRAAGRTEWMPERDRAAVHVHPFDVGLELALPGGDDRRERLVDLDQVEIADRQPVAVEDLLGRRDRPGQHQHGIDADGRLIDDARAGPQAELVRLLAAHQENGRRAVGDLRGVAGGDDAVVPERRLELGQDGERRLRANALVVGDDRSVHGKRHRLSLEALLVDRSRSTLLRADRDLVAVAPRHRPLLGDQLGAQPLGNELIALE